MSLFAALACLGACAQGGDSGALPGKPMTPEAFDAVADRVKALQEDANRFHASHDLKGKPAGTAVSRMTSEGFECAVEARDYAVVPADKPLTVGSRRVPVIHCERKPAEQDALCSDRRVTFKVAWEDAAAPVAQLWAQADRSLVTDQIYACTPASAAGGAAPTGR